MSNDSGSQKVNPLKSALNRGKSQAVDQFKRASNRAAYQKHNAGGGEYGRLAAGAKSGGSAAAKGFAKGFGSGFRDARDLNTLRKNPPPDLRSGQGPTPAQQGMRDA